MSFENLRAAAELARLQRRIREAQLAECGGAEFRTLELGCEAKHAAARLSAEAAAVARDPMSNEAVRVSAREAPRRADRACMQRTPVNQPPPLSLPCSH